MKIWSWRQAIEKSDLKPMTKLVLYTLANHMNEHGEGCFPTIPYIAGATGLKERAVYNHIKAAEKSGFLIRDKRQLAGQKWAANAYRAAYPKGMHLGAGLHEDTSLKEVHVGAGLHVDAGKGCTQVQVKGCTQVHTNTTTINSPINSPTTAHARERIPTLDYLKTDLNLNDFEICVGVVCDLFGRNLSPSEQNSLAVWCENYNMKAALPVLDKELKKFRRKNGNNPNSVNYFSKALAGAGIPPPPS